MVPNDCSRPAAWVPAMPSACAELPAVEAQQLARGRRRAEVAEHAGDVPAAVGEHRGR